MAGRLWIMKPTEEIKNYCEKDNKAVAGRQTSEIDKTNLKYAFSSTKKELSNRVQYTFKMTMFLIDNLTYTKVHSFTRWISAKTN